MIRKDLKQVNPSVGNGGYATLKFMFNKSHQRHNQYSFKKTLRILRTKLPPAYPVEIKYSDDFTDACFGSSELRGKKFILMVYTGQCEDMAIETLIHEWAHMISWTVGNNWVKWQDDHGPEFGVAFAKIYQVLVEK